MYQACRKWFENWYWPFSPISDGFLRPVILRVILPCSLAASGRSLAARLPANKKMATCTWPTTLPSFSTATACRSKEFSSSTAQQSFVDLSTRIRGGGGGLTARRKRKSSLLPPPPPPPPLFFVEVGRKRGGGRNSGAVRCTYLQGISGRPGDRLSGTFATRFTAVYNGKRRYTAV